VTASPHGDAVAASPRTRKYRGAVIGLGGVARGSHIPGFTFDEATRNRLEIVATVDGAPSVVPLDGVPQLVSRDDLALIEDVDFVDICTPTSSHLDLTIWALEHGYHVLCEKPVALTTAEALRTVIGTMLRLRYELRDEAELPAVADGLSQEELVKRLVEEFDAQEVLDDPDQENH